MLPAGGITSLGCSQRGGGGGEPQHATAPPSQRTAEKVPFATAWGASGRGHRGKRASAAAAWSEHAGFLIRTAGRSRAWQLCLLLSTASASPCFPCSSEHPGSLMGTRSGTSPAQHPPLLSIPLDLPRKKPGSGHSKSTRGWALRPHTGLGFHPSAHFPRGLQPEKPGRVAHTRERPTQSLEQLPKLSLPTDRRGKSLVPFSRSPNAFSRSLSPLFPRAAIPPGPGRVLHRGSAPGAARTGREGVLQRRRCSQARRDPAGIACKAMGSQNQ